MIPKFANKPVDIAETGAELCRHQVTGNSQFCDVLVRRLVIQVDAGLTA